MRHFTLAAAVSILTACSASGSTEEGTPSVDVDEVAPLGGQVGPHGKPEPGEHGDDAGDPPRLGLHAARGSKVKAPGNMTYHGGAVLTEADVTMIFWGAKWAQPAFVGDKITGLDDFYRYLGDTTYAQSNTEYTGTGGVHVGTKVTYTHAPIVDTSAAPSRAPKTSEIAAEVCRMIQSPVPNGYYPVYTDTRRGGAGYCAWHSYTTCAGVPVQFGFFFDLDGDSGCDPKDAAGVHSQGLAALANVSGHEWSETMTDPRDGGWWDSAGNENADKCAWSFGSPVVLSNGEAWKIQGNWSNAAFTAGTGYVNRNNQPGCIPQ